MVDYTRKLSLIFRILHHGDTIDEAETNIDGRALELTGPQIYLFSSSKLTSYTKDQSDTILKKEIFPALEKFLIEHGELTKKPLDGIVYDALRKLFLETQSEKLMDMRPLKRESYIKSHMTISMKKSGN